MTYIACKITLTPFKPFNEILIAYLGELGFESFTEDALSNELIAYIPSIQFDLEEVKKVLSSFQEEVSIDIEVNSIEKKNWNKKWEDSFEPIRINQFCLIRAPFHAADATIKYELIIEPKMSFGTGHHQTTQLMIELMQSAKFNDKNVLDMGSGTGILAILAKKMGAKHVDAIDIEEWAYENMQENANRNAAEINCYLGDSNLLTSKENGYGVVFANINKNILLHDMSYFDHVLKNGGELYLSGFFKTDVDEILASPFLKKYRTLEVIDKDEWAALKLAKVIEGY